MQNLSYGDLKFNADYQTLESTIKIPNGIDVVVTFSMDSYGGFFYPAFVEDEISLDVVFRKKTLAKSPKSFTVVHIQDPRKENRTTPSFKHNAVGERQANDHVLYFNSRNVTNLSNFASSYFEYVGKHGEAITFVQFSFSVILKYIIFIAA